jgi:hypothetical protein
MKKIFFALAAVAALASCSKSEVEYTQSAEIGIAPFTQNRTKAMVTKTEFPQENFMVWAYYKQLTAPATIEDWQASTEQPYSTQQTYIDEKPFKPSDKTGLWGGVTPYFWPKLGSLLFVGYYPATEDMAKLVSYEFTSDVNKMAIGDKETGVFFTPGDYETTGFVNNAAGAKCVEDFMYFNMTPSSCDGNTVGIENSVTTGYQIDVHFRHGLSWISVILAEAEGTPEGATITVNSVTFTDVNTNGTAVVNNSPDASKGETDEIFWTTTADQKDVVVWEGEKVLGKEETLEKQPVIIPQAMAGDLVINYTISSTDGSKFTETKKVSLASFDSKKTSWLPGKKYTYTITIGTSEILIDPSIVEWVTETPSLPIQ